MNIKKSSITHNTSRDIFWQKIYGENEKGDILAKAILCVTEEFLSLELKKSMAEMSLDKDIIQWFESKVSEIFPKDTVLKEKSKSEWMMFIYPQTASMAEAARNILDLRNEMSANSIKAAMPQDTGALDDAFRKNAEDFDIQKAREMGEKDRLFRGE